MSYPKNGRGKRREDTWLQLADPKGAVVAIASGDQDPECERILAGMLLLTFPELGDAPFIEGPDKAASLIRFAKEHADHLVPMLQEIPID